MPRVLCTFVHLVARPFCVRGTSRTACSDLCNAHVLVRVTVRGARRRRGQDHRADDGDRDDGRKGRPAAPPELLGERVREATDDDPNRHTHHGPAAIMAHACQRTDACSAHHRSRALRRRLPVPAVATDTMIDSESTAG